MRKWFALFLLALPASSSAAGFETVSYPSCSYATREASSSILTGLACGSVDYGDCSYASFSPDDVVSLTCRDYSISRLVAASSSGTELQGVTVTRMPRNTVELPLFSSTWGLEILSTPTGKYSLNMDSVQELLVLLIGLSLGLKFVLFLIRRAWFLFA